MRMSTRAQYAVRALVDLALHSDGKPVSLRDISRREEIPLNYLEQLFNRLKRGSIVKSVRGPGGGYLLFSHPGQIRLGDVVLTVEEPLNPVACLDEGGGCSRVTQCVTYGVWKELGSTIKDFLNSITLEDMRRQAMALAAIPGEAEADAS